MPELPEVETIVRELNEAKLVGLKIKKAEVFWDRSIAIPTPDVFCKKIEGQTIKGIRRRGKFLVFTLSNDTLMIHLRMTGKFLIDNSEISPFERVRLILSDKRLLRFEDMRKFGKWALCDTEAILEKIGLEPLSPDFTLANFIALFRGKKRQIKPFLLDQHYIAGIGNIYADEALWLAKIHPSRTTDSLTSEDLSDLHQAIITVLKKGIENIGTSLGAMRANYYSVSGRRGRNQDQLKVFRRNGLPCPRCRTPIQKIVVAQRGTHFCPHCQNN